MTLKFVLTNDTATVECDGKTSTVRRGSPSFPLLRRALLDEDWAQAAQYLAPRSALLKWAGGDFSYDEACDRLLWRGKPVAAEVHDRVRQMAAADESPRPLLRFYERLQKNPSWRSVNQLYGFLRHEGIPLEEDGTFLAYKGVRADYLDCHSSTFLNKPGAKHDMARNEISDDADVACHVGFHVGALAYARSFAPADGHVVICRVAPEDVVCVPKDSSQQKVRVCRYEVVGEWSGEALPSTTIGREDVPDGEEDAGGVDDDPDVDEASETTAPAVAPTPEPTPAPAPHAAVKTRPVPRRYRRYLALSSQQLMGLPIAELRDLATHGLAVVGASKLRGGKVALVSKILEVLESRVPAS